MQDDTKDVPALAAPLSPVFNGLFSLLLKEIRFCESFPHKVGKGAMERFPQVSRALLKRLQRP
jgi:hypothetical protein